MEKSYLEIALSWGWLSWRKEITWHFLVRLDKGQGDFKLWSFWGLLILAALWWITMALGCHAPFLAQGKLITKKREVSASQCSFHIRTYRSRWRADIDSEVYSTHTGIALETRAGCVTTAKEQRLGSRGVNLEGTESPSLVNQLGLYKALSQQWSHKTMGKGLRACVNF